MTQQLKIALSRVKLAQKIISDNITWADLVNKPTVITLSDNDFTNLGLLLGDVHEILYKLEKKSKTK